MDKKIRSIVQLFALLYRQKKNPKRQRNPVTKNPDDFTIELRIKQYLHKVKDKETQFRL